MGADLLYKTISDNHAIAINEYFDSTDIVKRMKKLDLPTPGIVCSRDRKVYEELGILDFYNRSRLRGVTKVSGMSIDDTIVIGKDEDWQIAEKNMFSELAQVYGDAARKYPISFSMQSCAFNAEYKYFSLEDMRYITNNGMYTTNKSAKPELLELLRQGVTHDI